MNVFILGVERSATTWISNILEAHPDTTVYMEPLSSAVSGFKNWPGRFRRIQNLDLYAQYFQHEFQRIKHRRRFLFTRLFDTSSAWRADSKLSAFIQRYLEVRPAADFQELNFHRINDAFDFPPSDGPIDVIKEVRMNYQSEIINRINSNAKVLVPMREYGPVVDSIKRNLERGNLVDFRKSLESYNNGKITSKTIFEYWYNSYNTLVSTLDSSGVNYKAITHKNMLEGECCIKEVIKWMGIGWNNNIKKYIIESSEEGKGKQTTRRNHQKLIRRIRKKKYEFDEKHNFVKEYPNINTHPDVRVLLE